jgi:transposase
VEVYGGNTGDPTTVVEQVNKLRERFQLSRVVLVGDRGMLTQPQEKLKAHPPIDPWPANRESPHWSKP